MRRVNATCFEAPFSGTTVGGAIDASNLCAASVAFTTTANVAAGSFKIQASNDPTSSPTHWVDIPDAVEALGVTPLLLTIPINAYRWLRPVFTGTDAGRQMVTTIAPGYAAAQVFTVLTVDDVSGSLNSTYWLFYAVDNSPAYYAWYNVDGLGVDPLLAGKIGVEVAIAANTTQDDIAIATDVALNATSAALYFTIGSADNEVFCIALTAGFATDSSDASAGHATGFAFSTLTPGKNAEAVQIPPGSYFLLNAAVTDGGTEYYVWMTIDGEGDDPALPDKIGVQVDLSVADDAISVAGALGGRLTGLTEFTVLLTGDVVELINQSSGDFVPATDFNTGFTVGLEPVTATFEALGV